MLPPTTDRLFRAETVPYFLWDIRATVGELRRLLEGGEQGTKDELIARILRDANTRDVWLFLDWATIEEAWPRIEHRLGRARPVWQMLLTRRRERVAEHGGSSSAR